MKARGPRRARSEIVEHYGGSSSTRSSGEAEYYGLVKGSSIALGTRSLIRDMGLNRRFVLRTYASGVTGIANRRGLAKVRYIDAREL